MANQRSSSLRKCLFCKRPQPAAAEKNECSVEVNGKASQVAFWVCEKCGVPENDPRGIRGIVLTETEAIRCDGKPKKEAVIRVVTADGQTVGIDGSKQSVVSSESEDGVCCCKACIERRQFEQDEYREVQALQKCWLQLRHAVRQMYRDRLLRDGMTGKGKKFNLTHLAELVEKICTHDPQQLYQRLESIGREHVMELKVVLLQILVSPEKAGVSVGADSESIVTNLSFEIAQHFLRNLLNSAGQFFETVDNMKVFLVPLEKEHLEKFGITWRIVNCNLFDSVVYHDPLLQATLPSIYSRLGLKTSLDDGRGDEDIAVILDRRSTPSHVADMMSNFMELGATLSVCRDRMGIAYKRMEEYVSKQMKIYKATLKAKQKVLKQDLEFFKEQRRLLEAYVMKKKELKRSSSSEDDVSPFAETLRCVLSAGHNDGQCEHSATSSECVRCNRSHCPCDQCSISHMITCGLSADCADTELVESLQFLEDLNDSSDSSSIDSEDSDYGGEGEFISDKGKESGVKRVKHTRMVCGDEHNVLKIEATILPKVLTTSVDCDDSTGISVQRHMYNAYGDWDVSGDPATLLFSSHWEEMLLPTCTRSRTGTLKLSDADKVAFMVGGGDCTAEDGKSTDKKERKSRPTGHKDAKNCTPMSQEKSLAEDKMKCVTTCVSVNHFGPTGKSGEVKPLDPTAQGATRKTTDLSCEEGANGCSEASPKKAPPVNPDRLCKTANILLNQIAYDWLKDPKNAKSAKELLECDVACLKDMNLDPETVKKLCSRYSESSPVKVNDQVDAAKCQTNGNDCQKQKVTVTMKTDHAGDLLSADEDDDSWSEHSSVMSQKGGKHCDCCYCEMFGHGGADIQRSCGRYEYPQIRERLRSKLKKKESELPSQKSENVDGYRGYESLDALLEYINGDTANKQRTAAGNMASSITAGGMKSTTISTNKKAKKSQSKAKKGENRKAEKRDHNQSSSCDKLSVTHCERSCNERQTVEGQNVTSRDTEPSKTVESDDTHNRSDTSVWSGTMSESQSIRKQYALAPKKSRRQAGEEEDVNIDEVFKPKDIDLNSTDLDEAEREVEIFKRFVMDCQPRENRTKVHLNMSHLLRDKKNTAAAAV